MRMTCIKTDRYARLSIKGELWTNSMKLLAINA